MTRPNDIPQPVRVLAEDLVLVDWGPMTLTISAWDRGLPRPVLAAQAARTALTCLADLADFQGFMRRKSADLPVDRPRPRVVDRAFQAARLVSEELTPLAAVAGAVADQVADAAAGLGADKVIVNNGGDVALRLQNGERAVVGLKTASGSGLLGRIVVGDRIGIRGVASSGWSGRSFSTGVADLVTVWAASAALADAAATLVAGRTFASGPNIEQTPARDLDPGSDLGDRPVTVRVGDLTPAQRREALTRGLAAVEDLSRQGLIRGALILVQGDMAVRDPDGLVFGRNQAPTLQTLSKSNPNFLSQGEVSWTKNCMPKV